MKRLSLPLVSKKISWSALIFFLTLISTYAGIVFNGAPGSAAPPPTLGGYTMFKFVDDTRPTGLGNFVSSVPASYDCPVSLGFNQPAHHLDVPTSFNNWSHGYRGDVYFSGFFIGGNTFILPANTRAFYFYAEPNLFSTFTITATANDGTTSGAIPVTAPNGARYYGFYTTGINCMLTTITLNISGNAGAGFGFTYGEFGINVDANNGAISCNNNIQISLDQDCWATVTPEMVLSGTYTPGCLGDFQVVVRDWNTNAVIDLDPNNPYPQIGYAQIGKKLKISVIDPYTGNSCWGTATVEDKLGPIIECVRDLRVECTDGTTPGDIGYPNVIEGCGVYDLTFKDVARNGSCEEGIDRIITRTWTAVDAQGNKSTCVQTIFVLTGKLSDIKPPLDYTGLNLPGNTYMLSCDAKRDANFDLASHLRPYPECVDEYLVDQEVLFNTGRREPRLLGWNCIASGPYEGHPSPDNIYYPAQLSCWADNSIVMWEGTGAPRAKGCGNIAITFKDIRIDLSKNSCDAGNVGCYKLLRTWTMLDWCTGEVREHNQIIKVMDTKGPEVLYPDHVDVNTDIWKCEGRWEVPPAWVKDNCSEEVHYTVRVENGTVLGNENSGYVVVNLPLGIQNAYIVAEDCCGNVTEKLIYLNVEDRTPPVAVCDQKTTVTITGNQTPGSNYAKVFATTFDDGSHDNCAPHLYFKVIRMDELAGTNNGSTKESTVCNKVNGDDDKNITGSQTYFDDHVSFCCADAGKTLMVVFRVLDADPGVGPIAPERMNQGGDLFGRFNDCMVEVEVQDKAAPSIVPPADVVVSCMFWFDLSKLTDPNDATFGRVVNDLSQRAKIKTTDIVCDLWCSPNPITNYPGSRSAVGNLACSHYNSLFQPAHPDTKYELAWGFDGYILSTCGATPIITIDDKRECGQGKIERVFSVRGPNNTLISTVQTIWVVDCDPLYISSEYCDSQDDIIWPDCDGRGTLVEGCGSNTSPDVTGRPKIINGADDACTLIAIQNFDEIFTIEQDACFKILRKWVVIDWCQYDPNISATHGRWEFTQVIKVRDTKKPIVTCNVGACEPAVLSGQTGACVGHISLTATATDSCTQADWLNYDYKIDAFNDGTIDFSVGPLTRRAFAAGDKPLVRNNPNADDQNNPFDASGVYPIGVHKITWYVEDGCGNIGQCSSLFEIKDCKAPTPYCLTGIITVPMPTSGCVDIWAKDLDFASFDNCTPKNRLKFYFDGDRAKTSIRVCCDDFLKAKVNDELRISVQMWVEDEEGNRDYCVTTVIVQDNQNICPNTGNLGSVTGELRTEDGRKSASATVDLYKSGHIMDSRLTLADGTYSFKDLELSVEHMLKSTRDDNPLNGVSTADIVSIQKHVLSKELLNSPYKIIAADVNNSKSVTSADIAIIRKLILGSANNFNNVASWTFIPEEVVFADKTQPWNYETEKKVIVNGVNQKQNFIAVKMGDVNNSSVAGLNQPTKTRTNSALKFEIAEQSVEAGQDVRIEFKAENFLNINGYQFTLNFDASALSFVKVEGNALSIDEDNFGTTQVRNGKVTTSWDARSATSIASNKVLFTLVFKSTKAVKLSNSLEITSDITSAEAYDAQMNESNVVLNVRSDKGVASSSVFELYQNNPNPFEKVTTINYRLPEASAATLTIYDVTGKVVRVMPLQGQKGLNTVELNRNDISGSGMFYYQLDAEQFSATKKMVITE
ncbi:MAG: T9SS type A sorting domain-containing protein [Saprospiraceae bacterium]|nr:T9SS type A sorting domain-containing protein [Saprospiraceae bacterium]